LIWPFKKSKQKKRSILDTQKPLRKRAGKQESSGRKASLIVVGSIGLLALAYAWRSYAVIERGIGTFQVKVLKIFNVIPRDWQIQISEGSGSDVSEDVRKDIYASVQRSLDSADSISFSGLSETISAIGRFDHVSILRPQFNTLLVIVKTRVPVMVTNLDGKIRYISEEGNIYIPRTTEEKNVDANAVGATTLVECIGLIDSKRTHPLQYDGSSKAVLTGQENERTMQAIHLKDLVHKFDLSVKSIHFQGFRGFSFYNEDKTEIVLGQPPFDYKMEKLRGIFAKLRSKGTVAAKIELDYDGKAFIKERKL
jgi:hypothetical protein